ncbi:hypothetical protein [Winogradskyella sp.]|uniref:hypothetical protein n=1 Tax=Winogradskyella sp. TaxID=1883156 RepID=UPI002610171A|nr:hypothetical protein [Winogradskyella sp.]
MKMKFFTAVALLILQFSFAQEPLTAEEMADYQNKLMIDELNLTEAQKKPVEEINLKYAIKQKALIEKEGSMFGKIGDMKKIKKEKSSELEKVLTEEQLDKYEDDLEPKIRKYMKKKMKP